MDIVKYIFEKEVNDWDDLYSNSPLISKKYILLIITQIIEPSSNWDIVTFDNFSSVISSDPEKVRISLTILEQKELQMLTPYLWITKILLFFKVTLLG